MTNENTFESAKNYIDTYPLENHAWVQFLHKANQSEFLASQESFFYAVQAFPRMLCVLASKIENSSDRLLVMENLWEEHGNGNASLFHTQTYYTYLKALGLNKDINNIKHNPWVDDWVATMLHSTSARSYAASLAGIEFIYTRISALIVEKLKCFDLHCEQNHYATHSVIDYGHANDLLQVALQQSGNTCIMTDFERGVALFMQMFEKMVHFTAVDAAIIAQDKVAFYYGREDSIVEVNTVKSINKEIVDVLMICSGGENAIGLLQCDKNVNITALDINPNQIALAKAKINDMKILGCLSSEIATFENGKFEKLFTAFKSFLSNDELLDIPRQKPHTLSKLHYVCDHVFSNSILEVIFTQEATKYSKESFSEHFFNVFKNQIKYSSWHQHTNMACVLGQNLPIDYSLPINPESSIDYFEGSFQDYFSNTNATYDMIDVSNISDWMSKDSVMTTLQLLYSQLNAGGYFIGRKLLGDYDWVQLIKECGLDMDVQQVQDTTDFYTQTIVAKK